MSDYIIKVEHLSKRYTIRHQNGTGDGLRHAIHDFATAPLRWLRKHGAWSMEHGATNGAPGSPLPAPSSEEFWALRGVSFEVKQGEVVGIIGRNGAGKSTLLKILSRITEPTEGRVRIRGRVASLLEVGTGFHPELTGRENIFVNGAILGMTRVEIAKKFDEIVAFADIEKFLDTPVKRYSSGMYVRLAFAVAAHLEPEILIVDEVLAVGDFEFQKRCLGKMNEVATSGRTVLFVSHNMAAVRSLCRIGICLERGRIADLGDAGEIITRYLSSISNTSQLANLATRQDRAGTGAARIVSITFCDKVGHMVDTVGTGDPMRIRIGYRAEHPILGVSCQLAIYNEWGVPITFLSTEYTRDLDSVLPPNGIIECYVPTLALAVGRYFVDFCLKSDGVKLDHIERAASFVLRDDGFFPSGSTPPASYGAALYQHHWSLAT